MRSPLAALCAVALCAAPAQALPPLLLAVDTADPGLRVFLRPGELLLAGPTGDDRAAVRPLAGPGPVPLPASLDGWSALHAPCDGALTAAFSRDGRPAEARLAVSPAAVEATVWVEGRLVAQGALARPVTPCRLAVAEADALPGPEVIFTWTGPGGVRGLTVWRVPDTAR
jgi:hypothetical protein